jgi:hypothetical protein
MEWGNGGSAVAQVTKMRTRRVSGDRDGRQGVVVSINLEVVAAQQFSTVIGFFRRLQRRRRTRRRRWWRREVEEEEEEEQEEEEEEENGMTNLYVFYIHLDVCSITNQKSFKIQVYIKHQKKVLHLLLQCCFVTTVTRHQKPDEKRSTQMTKRLKKFKNTLMRSKTS